MDPYNSADTLGGGKPQDNPYAAPAARLADLVPEGVQEKAGRGVRLGAVLLDVVPAAIVAIVAAILIPAVGSDGGKGINTLGGVLLGVMVLLMLGYAVYQLVQLHRTGQTFGKKVLGIKIVRTDGSRAGLGRIFLLRMFVPGLAGAVPFIGPLFSLADPLFIFGEERRCLHDMIADTIVVVA